MIEKHVDVVHNNNECNQYTQEVGEFKVCFFAGVEHFKEGIT